MTHMNLDYLWLNPESLAEPANGAQVFADAWWLADDRGHIAFYRKGRSPLFGLILAPQCNVDKRVADMILPRTPGATQVIQVPLVFINHSEDYGYYISHKRLEELHGTHSR